MGNTFTVIEQITENVDAFENIHDSDINNYENKYIDVETCKEHISNICNTYSDEAIEWNDEIVF
jgi:hypothetical protein